MKSFFITMSGALLMCCAAVCDAQVTVDGAWVRATAPGQKIAGAYLKITSVTAAFLVGASSPAAKTVELHEMSMDNNVMKMRPVARLELPAGKTVELKPGSYHLMLIDVARPLVAGASVPITLKVEDQHGKRQAVGLKAQVGELVAGDHHHDAK
jgi:copper(I)-binding protein